MKDSLLVLSASNTIHATSSVLRFYYLNYQSEESICCLSLITDDKSSWMSALNYYHVDFTDKRGIKPQRKI